MQCSKRTQPSHSRPLHGYTARSIFTAEKAILGQVEASHREGGRGWLRLRLHTEREGGASYSYEPMRSTSVGGSAIDVDMNSYSAAHMHTSISGA